MKTVLLISNEVLHYREKVYNYFFDRFKEDGYDLTVLSNKFQKVDLAIRFNKIEEPFSIKRYLEIIAERKPSCVIIFLHLKDTVIFPVIWYCKTHKIPIIYWNHGINIRTPNNRLKNSLFHYIHNMCDALITYTPEMRKYFSEKNQKKLFIGYNTLNFTDINKSLVPDKQKTKVKYGIKENKVILYISRMLPYKRVDLLMDCFQDLPDIAVVMVGPGFSEEQRKRVQEHKNLYYLGEKYGADVNEIYKMGDLFSTPGHIGLAVNEAMFWGLPIVVLEGIHAPEVYYMKNNETGYFAKDEQDYKDYVIALLDNDCRRKQMSERTLEVFEQEVSIDRMYQGFIDAIRFCEKN